MDAAQILLFIVVVVLSVLLVVLGVEVFLILRDLRRTIAKADKMLDSWGQITDQVSEPLTRLSSMIAGFKTGATLTGIIKRIDSLVEKSDGKK